MREKTGFRACAAVCCALAGAAGFAGEVEVRSSTLCIRFDEGAKGEVCSALAHGRDYASPIARFPLVELGCCPVTNRAKQVLVTTRQAEGFAVERTANGVRLVYRNLGDAVEEVVCTVEAKDEDVLWRLSAKPKPGWGLVETHYPMFALNERLGATPEDDAIVIGRDDGGLQRNPMRPGREYWNDRRVGRAPGALVSPFGFYFDDAGGLYTAVYDNEEYPKQLLMDRWWRLTRPDGSYKHGDFLLRWDRYNYSEAADVQPYAVVMRGLKGADGAPTTWYDAADLYKDWAHRQTWSKVKFLDRPDLPDWAKDAPAVMGFNRAWFDRPDLLRKWLTDYWMKKFPGVPLIAILEGWEQHGDWVAAEYFPCYPTDEKFREYCKWIKEAGGHPWPWPGGHHWNVKVGKKPDGTFRLDFSKDFQARAAAHAVTKADGNLLMKPLGWLGGGESAVMCPGDPWTVDWWNRDIACELVKRGADLVQADQDCNGTWSGGDCWSTTHGHPVGPGVWASRAMRHQFETMLAEMRKVNPWALFSFEDSNEKYNDIMSFVDYRNCRDRATEWASVFNYMYHEYVSPFQSGSEQYGRPYWLAFCAVDGQVPRLPVTPSYYNLSDVFPNGGFENRLEGGGFADWEKPESHLVSEDAATGRYAVRIVSADGKYHQVARSLRASDFFVPGRTYRISVAFKSIRNEKGACLDVSALVHKDGKYRHLGGVHLEPATPAKGWQRLSKTFVMPTGAEQVRFMLNVWGGAECLADDINVEELQSDGSYAPLKHRGTSDALAFCENWIRLYHGEGRKYLAHGKQLRPPEFRCEILPYHENFRGHAIDNVKPSVFHVLWEARDGSRALALANATVHEQPVAWKLPDGTWRKDTLGPRELKLVPYPVKSKVDVMCVYYPHWHRYQKGDEWFGAENWKQGEWAYVKTAKPRFAGHNQPIVPYGGFRDESDPKQMEVDIALAANAGIDVFLYDYYYYNGQITQEDALEKGFLGAANRNRMKFALMWCYHERNNQFRVKSGEPRVPLMSLAHTPEEFLGLIDLSVARYFNRPEYYRKDGKLFFSIYDAPYFLKCIGTNEVKSAIAEARRRVRAAGLGELHLNAQNARAAQSAALKDVGFDSLTHYGNSPWTVDGFHRKFVLEKERIFDYSWMVEGSHRTWAEMRTADLPYIPSVQTGWDSTPRCRDDEPFPWKNRDYPYTYTFTNNTPDAVQAHLAAAKAYAESDPRQPGIVYINGWNEYTEGSFLIPNNFTADGLLRAVAAVFGRQPADEYTYINPSSGKLLTVPAATYENVAYGSHAKQKIDLWLPPSAAGKVPLLVYVHGGGWGGGAMCDAIIGPKIGTLLDRGVAVACVGYRYLRETERGPGIPPVKGCVDDVAAAIRFLKSSSDTWGLDVSRIGLAGGSAGACTVLILAYRNGNDLGIRAIAPIVPQTSMDPAEMREWIPNSTYGAQAFGYRNFDDWLAHRDEHPEWIAAYSPAALARRIDPAKAPRVILRAPQPKSGELPKDPTHAAAFSWRFAEICWTRGLPCDILERGDALLALIQCL